MTHTKLVPIVHIAFSQAWGLLGISTYFLQGVNAAEHDWHHEKFIDNYSLSYTYLDKLFGTYNTGRIPGEQVSDQDSENIKNVSATYTELKNATVEDFEAQGKAFDAYQEAGYIVENMLNLVRNMKVLVFSSYILRAYSLSVLNFAFIT